MEKRITILAAKLMFCFSSILPVLGQEQRFTDSPLAEGRYVQESDSSTRTAGYAFRYEFPGKSPYQRGHYSILRTFRDAVGTHWESTVRVLKGDRQLCIGVVVEQDGWVVTKSSEVPDGAISVRFADASRADAKVVSRRPDCDLALLKVERSGLKPITWDKTASADVGSFVATTDSRSLPLALGVVSVKPRNIRPGHAVLGVRLDESEDGVVVAVFWIMVVQPKPASRKMISSLQSMALSQSPCEPSRA